MASVGSIIYETMLANWLECRYFFVCKLFKKQDFNGYRLLFVQIVLVVLIRSTVRGLTANDECFHQSLAAFAQKIDTHAEQCLQ